MNRLQLICHNPLNPAYEVMEHRATNYHDCHGKIMTSSLSMTFYQFFQVPSLAIDTQILGAKVMPNLFIHNMSPRYTLSSHIP